VKLAFTLYKYFPYGGLQRDFLAVAQECHCRGHDVSAYVLEWHGEVPAWLDLHIVPVKGLSSHTRYARYSEWLERQNIAQAADVVIGFNKMPGLDIYFAADPCYAEKVDGRGALYRSSGRCKHFQGYEEAVFSPDSKTEILTIARNQRDIFHRYYGTPHQRFHELPPGIDESYQSSEGRDTIRCDFRREFGLADDDFLMVMIGSGFKTKGLDRALEAVSSLPEELKKTVKFFVVGQDNPKRFLRKIKSLKLQDQVKIFSGRSDVRRFLFGADLMLHPAYFESAGKILLEGVASGLPVLVTEACGYAHYIDDAQAGCVLADPFQQEKLNDLLARMMSEILSPLDKRMDWSGNGLRFAGSEDLYSQKKFVVDVIESYSRGGQG
jgi:UDP-glucose:(heptosyl)LPS alpha-1,3-glucosyltransferase